MRIVVAVGGNALIRAGQAGTWEEQLANVREIAAAVLALRGLGHDVVLTHGNGPHVGALLLQNKLGESEAEPLPLDALIAMTQGWIGYLLESSFAALDPGVPTAVLLTRVMVDREDPAFGAPDKPVGPFYDEAEARRRADVLGWDVAPDAGRGWRRVVPSPHPLEVLGERHVRALLEQGSVVIACGGGGIPVAEQGREVVGCGRRDRQGPLLGPAGGRHRRRPARAADRRAARGAGLRHPVGARGGDADRRRRGARARGGRVPRRQHGAEDRVRAAASCRSPAGARS